MHCWERDGAAAGNGRGVPQKAKVGLWQDPAWADTQEHGEHRLDATFVAASITTAKWKQPKVCPQNKVPRACDGTVFTLGEG